MTTAVRSSELDKPQGDHLLIEFVSDSVTA
jgi:hypothetical protein